MKFNCPHCTQRLHSEDNAAGRVVRCPNCNRRLTIPAAPAAEPTKPTGASAGPASPNAATSAARATPSRRAGSNAPPRPAAASTATPQTATKSTPARPPVPARPGAHARGHRSDGTNVSPWGALAIGSLLGGMFYLAIYLVLKDAPFGALFLKRGWVPFVLVFLMGWSCGILILKTRRLRSQKQAMLLDVLPTELGEDISVENVERFREHIYALPSRLHASFMVKRMRLGLEHFQVRRSNPEVANMMMSQSEIDAGSVQSSYALLKAFVWAIPILGFIGTVIGISDAVGGFSGSLSQVQDIEILKNSLNDVTGGLAVAFDTTLIALVMSLVISIPASAMQKAEEDLLGWVDAYCNENLLKRLNDAGGLSDVAGHTEAIMRSLGAVVTDNQQTVMEDFKSVQGRMEELQHAQKEMLNGLAAAVDTQLQSMEKRAAEHQKHLEATLAKVVAPVEESMTRLKKQVEGAEKTTGDALQVSAEEVRKTCAALADGIGSLNTVLKELGGRQIVIEKPGLFGFLRRARHVEHENVQPAKITDSDAVNEE